LGKLPYFGRIVKMNRPHPQWKLGTLGLGHPDFAAFFHLIAVDHLIGVMDSADLAYFVEKPWKWQDEYNRFATLANKIGSEMAVRVIAEEVCETCLCEDCEDWGSGEECSKAPSIEYML